MNNAPILLLLAYFMIIFTLIGSWVWNIILICTAFDAMTSGEVIVRVAGIFIPIVGAIAGFF